MLVEPAIAAASQVDIDIIQSRAWTGRHAKERARIQSEQALDGFRIGGGGKMTTRAAWRFVLAAREDG
jgi:hypothetical protein